MADNTENKITISGGDVTPITVTFNEKEVFTFNYKTIDKITQYVLAVGTALNDMVDISISGVDDNHILRYSASSSSWVNVLMSEYLESFVGGSQVIMSGGKINIDQSKINHNLLLNYVLEQHRTINDDGTLSTELFSAEKIITINAGKAETIHTHTEADITDLDKYTQAEVTVFLAAKAALVHLHTESDISDLDKYTRGEITSLLSLKAALSHVHVEADITDLDKYTQAEVNALVAAKAALVHNHNGLYYTETELDNGVLDALYYTKIQLLSDGTLDARYYTETEIDAMLLSYALASHNHDDRYYTKSANDALLALKAAVDHNHNSIYYTQDELDEALNLKSNTTHTHDTRYYTQAQVDALVVGFAPLVHYHDDRYFTENEIEGMFTLHLNTYDHTELHAHANKALLDTYLQTEIDLEDAVDFMHLQGTDSGTDENDWYLGDGTDDANKNIYADTVDPINKPAIRFNITTSVWQYSNNGTTFANIGSGGSGGAGIWGFITGTLSDQTDLQSALDAKAVTVHTHTESQITDLDKYTEAEVNALLALKAALVHTHIEANITDLDKYTQAEVNALVANSSNWDIAYGWGNHASAGYLTIETDPVFLASEAASFAVGDKSKLDGIEQLAVSLLTVKSDIDIASAISLKHSNSLDHTQNTDTSLLSLIYDGENELYNLSLSIIPTSNAILSLGTATNRFGTIYGGSLKDENEDASSFEDIHSAVLLKHDGSTQDTAIGLNTTHRADTSNPHSVDKIDVGLSNVDNKSEATIILDVKADTDVADAITLKHDGSVQDTAINLNTTHRTSDGSDHTFLDQSVINGATPIFGINNFTDGGGLVLITSTQEINFETAYTHSLLTAGNPHGVIKSDISLGSVDDVQQLPMSYLDIDETLLANSDVKVASQKATKTYIDALLAANDAMVYKGAIDCSTNPDYPAADAGHTYRTSAAGKIGGALGINVEIGELLLCNTDSTVSGDEATVGVYWNIIQSNLDGAVIGATSSVDSNLSAFDGISGKLIKDSGIIMSDVALAVSNKHTPGTDQYLDYGGSNQVAVADVKDAVDKKPAEGTFIPDLTFGGAKVGITYANQTGKYTKIGNIVYLTLDITLTNKGTSIGVAIINGLPFTVLNDTVGGGSANPVYFSAMATTFTHCHRFESNTITITLGKENGVSVTQIADTDFTNTSRIIVNGFYFTA